MGDVSEYFKTQTKTSILSQVQIYRSEAISLLAQIKQAEREYELLQSSNLQQWSNRIKDNNRNSSVYKNNSTLHQILVDARQELELTKYYQQGYTLLNNIGHMFHGEWEYTVVVTSKTAAGSQNISFRIPEYVFTQLLDFNHLERATLVNKTTILEKMKEYGIQGSEWIKNSNSIENQHNYDVYTYIIDYAKSILKTADGSNAVVNYNTGQVLEGYLALSEQKGLFRSFLSTVKSMEKLNDQAKNEHLGSSRFNNLQSLVKALQDQTNSRGFWSGPDTKSAGQIKGMGASVYKNSTITRQLEKFCMLTEQLEYGMDFSALETAVQSNVKPSVQRQLQRDINYYLNELISAFDATTVSRSSQLSLDSRMQDIFTGLDKLL